MLPGAFVETGLNIAIGSVLLAILIGRLLGRWHAGIYKISRMLVSADQQKGH